MINNGFEVWEVFVCMGVKVLRNVVLGCVVFCVVFLGCIFIMVLGNIDVLVLFSGFY